MFDLTPPSPLSLTVEGCSGQHSPSPGRARARGGEVFLLALLLFAACGAGGAGGTADATPDAIANPDATLDAPFADVDDATSAEVPVTFHAIPDPPKVGTYRLEIDDTELSVTVTDGRLFVLRAKIGCKGSGSPCVYERSIPEITCSTSFAKGYTAALSGNHAVVPVKNDTLELWVTAVDTLEGVYHLTPGKCCEAHRIVRLPYVDAVACQDYQTPDCDPFDDTVCAEEEHCVYDSEGRPSCAIDGPTSLGGACDGSGAACAEGTCIDLSGTGSRCYRYCRTDVDCAGLGCLELTDSTYKVCQLPASAFEACDLLAPACAKASDACYPSSITNAPICLAAGSTAEGDACTTLNACAPGLLCVNQTCRAVCRVGGGQPACADAFAACQAVYGQVGACMGQ